MPENKKIFSCDFDIKGNIPPELIGAFTQAQAKLLGLRGFIEQTAEGVRGNIQGEQANIEKIQEVLKAAEQFKDLFKEFAFAKIKEIKEFTHENFEFKKK